MNLKDNWRGLCILAVFGFSLTVWVLRTFGG